MRGRIEKKANEGGERRRINEKQEEMSDQGKTKRKVAEEELGRTVDKER